MISFELVFDKNNLACVIIEQAFITIFGQILHIGLCDLVVWLATGMAPCMLLDASDLVQYSYASKAARAVFVFLLKQASWLLHETPHWTSEGCKWTYSSPADKTPGSKPFELNFYEPSPACG